MTSELKRELIKHIGDLLITVSITDVAEKFYDLIFEKKCDDVKVRNSLIIKEFDEKYKSGNIKVCDIYDMLACKYDCSMQLIRYIIAKRRAFEICQHL